VPARCGLSTKFKGIERSDKKPINAKNERVSLAFLRYSSRERKSQAKEPRIDTGFFCLFCAHFSGSQATDYPFLFLRGGTGVSLKWN